MEDHAVFVIVRDGECLFVQRSMQKKHLPGAWAFASGTVESGESIEQAAEREALEEFGVAVMAEKVFANHELAEVRVRLNFALCTIVEGEPKILQPEEAQALAWMSLSRFFDTYTDDQIGHGLRWLRANPSVWQAVGL